MSIVTSFKRDLKRAFGLESYETLYLSVNEGWSHGPFARSNTECECEDCGTKTRYFHVIRDETTYPVFTRDHLKCHDCYLAHRTDTIPFTNYKMPHPEDVFSEVSNRTGGERNRMS